LTSYEELVCFAGSNLSRQRNVESFKTLDAIGSVTICFRKAIDAGQCWAANTYGISSHDRMKWSESNHPPLSWGFSFWRQKTDRAQGGRHRRIIIIHIAYRMMSTMEIGV